MCHLWHNSICDAAASGNFHMYVHMLRYTEKIRVGEWRCGASAVIAEALSTDIAWSIVMRDIGRPYLISLGGKIRWKSWSQRILSSASGKLTDIMLFDLQPKLNSWLAMNAFYKHSIWLRKWFFPLLIKKTITGISHDGYPASCTEILYYPLGAVYLAHLMISDLFIWWYCKENNYMWPSYISAQIIQIQQVFFTHHYTETISAAFLFLISLWCGKFLN